MNIVGSIVLIYRLYTVFNEQKKVLSNFIFPHVE